MLSRNGMVIFLVSSLLLLSSIIGCAQEQVPERLFKGIWIRKPTESKKFDPFAPDFVIIDQINGEYFTLFVNSVIEGDRLLANSFHHFYRVEGETLISNGTHLSRTSIFHLTSNGELVEIIEIPEVGESGENVYVRPTIDDFAPMIKWYGYELGTE
jgi:hypothetical protein